MLLGGTGFQPVCLYSHRLEAGATQESPEIIYSSQRLLLHPRLRLVVNGSWLNIAEMELSVLSRQCLGKRR
jgi:hypothetical protein